MDNQKCNNAISCTVCDCVHHNRAQSACSLSSIQVGCCGPTTSDCACTQCASFKKN